LNRVTEPTHSLLLLVPAYNEEARIGPVLEEFAEYFQRNYSGKFQLTVVLNGCKDDTIGVVRRVGEKYPAVTALEFTAPIGKGGALIEGLKLAPLADLIGYVDADGATGPEAFHKLVKLCGPYDCVIGSRWKEGAVLHRKQPWLRRFASRCFHAWVQFLLRLDIKDTQCPAKIMRRAAVEKIHGCLLIADMAFDVNLLYVLRQAGYTIWEEEIEWTDKVGSKLTGSLVRSSIAMGLSVLRLRWIYWPIPPWVHKLVRPVTTWAYPRIYKLLRAPQSLPNPGPAANPAVARGSANE
jgi:glycosyltransferase involved in cell wall biosynthesis